MSNNCDTVTIKSNDDFLKHTFKCSINSPHKSVFEAILQFNDTVIINGIKTPPMDTVLQAVSSDYYGSPPLTLEYKKYKATEVHIKYTYCFH